MENPRCIVHMGLRCARPNNIWKIPDVSSMWGFAALAPIIVRTSGIVWPPFFFSTACAVRSTKFMHSALSLRSPHTCPACFYNNWGEPERAPQYRVLCIPTVYVCLFVYIYARTSCRIRQRNALHSISTKNTKER